MGKWKLKIKRPENKREKQMTYLKRRFELEREAKKLAIEDEFDFAFLSISSEGKPTVCAGLKSDFVSIVGKVLNMPPEEREARQAETMESLMELYIMEGKDIDPKDFSLKKSDILEEMKEKLKEQKEELAEKQKKLSKWMKTEEIDDLVLLQEMDNYLVKSLRRIDRIKCYISGKRSCKVPEASKPTKDPWVPLSSSQNGIHIGSTSTGTAHGIVRVDGDAGTIFRRNEESSEGFVWSAGPETMSVNPVQLSNDHGRILPDTTLHL